MEMLQNYSIEEIIIFFVIAGVTIKGFISFWDWGTDRLRKVFKKEHEEQKEKDDFQERFEKNEESLKILSNGQEQINNILSNLNDKVNLLVNSDKDDIKAFITREHHYFCYQKKWIDDYSLDCIERRFEHYKKEKGNSFIARLMEEIRNLPKNPPDDEIQ